MKKRLLPALAALFLLLLCAVPAAGAADIFTDVKAEAVLNAVQTLNSLGAIEASEKFDPSGQLTRAMFCSIAVPLSGITDVTPYENYTVFPDVRANHWALGYVNAAVRELKLLGSRPDGTFAPDEAITFDEAITIMVRMLGYSEVELGYNWPRNYQSKAAALGLTAGISQTKTLTRAQGAILFYNMLYIDVKDDNKPYIEAKLGIKTLTDMIVVSVSNSARKGLTLSDGVFYPSHKELDESLEGKLTDVYLDGKGYVLGVETRAREISNVVVINTHGKADDGSPRIITDDDTGFYPLRTAMGDESLDGARVDIVLDSDGYVYSITTRVQQSKAFVLASANELGVTDATGTATVISPSAKLYVDGTVTTYSAAYASMQKGEELIIYYKSNGSTDYILWMKNPEPLTKTVKNVLLTDTDAMDEDGTPGITAADGTFYPTRSAVSETLKYKRVDLEFDVLEYVVKVTATEQQSKAMTLALADTLGIAGNDGIVNVIPPPTTVYVDDTATIYSAAYASMKRGENLVIYYKGNGTPDYIVWDKPPEPLTKTVSNVIILNTDAMEEDGTPGIITGDDEFYPVREGVGAELQYRRVDLELDVLDYVISVIPRTQRSKNIRAALVSALGVTASNGGTTIISPSTTVYVDGNTTNYSAAAAQIKKGDDLDIFYKGNGTVDYVVWTRNSGDGADVVTSTALKAGTAGVTEALGVSPDGLNFVKNGVETTADCVQPYDTLRYSGKTVNVSSLRVSAYYPGGAVTEFAGLYFTPAATLQAMKFSYGDRVTLCISSDGTVGAVLAYSDLAPNAVGYMKNGGEVEMVNGVTFNGTVPSGIYAGMPVSISFNVRGELQITHLTLKTGGSYDTAAATAGGQTVADWCKYYTMSGAMVRPVEKSELPGGVIAQSEVKHVYKGDGGIEIMFIAGVSGDALACGFAEYVPESYSGAMIVGLDENAGIKLKGYNGTTDKISLGFEVSQTAQSMDGAFVTVELTTSGKDLRVNSITRCLSYTVSQSDISGGYVAINGVNTRISDDCLEYGVFFRRGDRAVKIENMGDVITETSQIIVYCDKSPSLGGKVRWIEIR